MTFALTSNKSYFDGRFLQTAEDVTSSTPMSETVPDMYVVEAFDKYASPVWYMIGLPGNMAAYVVWIQPRLRHSSGCYLAALGLNDCFFLVLHVSTVALSIAAFKPINQTNYVWILSTQKLRDFSTTNAQLGGPLGGNSS